MAMQGGTMADHQDAEFIMSQVKLAAVYKAAGDLARPPAGEDR
jgi:hypothetical protein